MIERYFIRTKAKSKGYFKGWRYNWRDKNQCEALPSFTKQSALANSFTTEEDAQKEIDSYVKDCTKGIAEATARIHNYTLYKTTWGSLTDQERFDIIKRCNISVSLSHRVHGYRTSVNTWNINKYDQLNGTEIIAITKYDDWDSLIETQELAKKLQENRLKYIKDHLIIVNDPLEIKFKDSERKQIKWIDRGENDTSYGYCSACGGAVPSISQLMIGYDTVICAICMGKLAEEAKKHCERIPDDIMEHYQTDRFLRSLG